MLHTVKGRLVTSTKNGASIFLPAAGHRYDTRLNGVGSHGDYWSSSLTEVSNCAVAVFFGSDGYYFDIYDELRFYGFSVRPVAE